MQRPGLAVTEVASVEVTSRRLKGRMSQYSYEEPLRRLQISCPVLMREPPEKKVLSSQLKGQRPELDTAHSKTIGCRTVWEKVGCLTLCPHNQSRGHHVGRPQAPTP